MDVGREGYSVDARVIGVPPRVLKSTPPSKGVNKAKSRIDELKKEIDDKVMKLFYIKQELLDDGKYEEGGSPLTDKEKKDLQKNKEIIVADLDNIVKKNKELKRFRREITDFYFPRGM